MAGSTLEYGMAFFDFGEDLASPLSVRLERERFVLIDRQLYAYFSVFGNGVVAGWEVTDNGQLGVNISPGVGIINSYGIESSFIDAIFPLPPNTTGFIYAKIDSNSVLDRQPDFVFTINPLFDGSLLLATVTTTGAAVTSIDNTVRTEIGFQEIIDEAIAAHRHDGITSPRIDLTQEVQGELPMSRMADLDAAKIVSGKLPEHVMPTTDHNALKNAGILNHAQLDALTQTIQKDNTSLFGEVTTINLMKLILAIKYQTSDVDQFMENLLCIIPGISPNSYIDWEASNANIDTDTNCVSGLPSLTVNDLEVIGEQTEDGADVDTLQLISVPWETDQDFRLASSTTNIVIKDGVKISKDTVTDRVIESFDEGLNGETDGLYSNTLEQNSTIVVEFDTNAANGPLAGRFEMLHSRFGVFRREFSQTQDWSSYDTLNILVQSSNASHASVSFTIYDSEENAIATFLLLATNEVTTFADDAINGFVKKSFSIDGFDRSDVSAIEFKTDTVTNAEEFFLVDTISLTSDEFLLPQGNIKLRYNTTASVLFNTIDYDVELPEGTDLRVRVKVSSTLEGLAVSPYTSLLSSGESFGIAGSYIEIDITLIADDTFTKTPLLTGVRLSVLVPAQEAGLSITSAEEWNSGTKANIAVDEDGVLSMDKTNVGNFYFANGITVNELDTNLVPVAGVTSDNMPIAPYQGYAAINQEAQLPDEYDPGREFLRGLFRPRSVYRLISGNFLVADTGNDRIMEFTQDGIFVRGYASHNHKYDDRLYALTSNYNPRLGVLFITFSRDVDVKFADLTTITISIGNSDIRLSNSVDFVRNVGTGEIIERPELEAFLDGSSGNFQGVADNTLSILLSDDKQATLADNLDAAIRVRIEGNPSPATNATLVPGDLSGLECFVGDYMYFGKGGIWRPIYANETETDRFVYCNAIVNYDKDALAPVGVASIIEFNKSIGSEISGVSLGSSLVNSDLQFADFILGSALYFKTTTSDGQDERKLLVSGLSRTGSNLTSSSSSGSSTLGNSEAQKLSSFVGKTAILNMGSNLIEWSYISSDGSFPSDSFFDDDGNIVISESSLSAQSGRIITVNSLGVVVKLIEGGLFTKIWDVRKLLSGNIFVST